MKGTCPKCGAPLKKGNIKVIRPRGKKRPWRECRRCPELKPVQVPFPGGDTAGNGLQRSQGTTGGPITVDLVFDYSAPPTYRYFMTQDQADRVKRALDKPILKGFGIGFEVIPVPDYQVEADPEAFADLVEVTIDWKGK